MAASNLTGVAGLLNSGAYSDVELICEDGGKVFPAHRAVLCSNSRMFESAAKECWQVRYCPE